MLILGICSKPSTFLLISLKPGIRLSKPSSEAVSAVADRSFQYFFINWSSW